VKKLSVIAFLVSFCLFISPVFAQVDLKLSEDFIRLYAGESKEVYVTIFNNQDIKDNFVLSIWPLPPSEVSLSLEKYLLTLEPHTNQTIKMFLSAPECAGETTTQFKISTKATTTNATISKNFILSVSRRYIICISDFKLDKYGPFEPKDSFKITVDLTNPTIKNSPDFYVQINIEKDNKIVKRFDDYISTLQQKSSTSVSHTYTFDKYASPGEYMMEILLKDNKGIVKSSKNLTVEVKAINNTVFKRSTELSLLSAITTVVAKNEGNVPVPITIRTSIPSFAKNLFFAKVAPNRTEETTGWVEYVWYFENVKPGEEVKVVYEIKLFYVWVFGLILVAIVIFAFKFVYGPTLVKKYKKVSALKPGKELTIALEVKNRSRHEITNVEVKDLVPKIFKLTGKFGTLKPTSIKKTDKGTILVWKFKSINPMDERVLTYGIQPTIEMAGKLRLPKAIIKYLDKKKRIKKLISKSILLKP